MTPRRSCITTALLVTAVCSCSGENGRSHTFYGGPKVQPPTTGFLTAPQPAPSTLSQQRYRHRGAVKAFNTSQEGLGTMQKSSRRRRALFANGARSVGISARRNERVHAVYGTRENRSKVVQSIGGGAAAGGQAVTEAQMDAEWEQILAADDDEDEEDEADEDEDGDDMTDQELLLGFDVHDGDFDDTVEGGIDGLTKQEGGRSGEQRLQARMPYKQRMKLEKQKQEAWIEKRKTFSPEHNAYLDLAEKNKAIAAARREKYTKKFFRKKKIYDIIKEKGRKEEREAVWAKRWPRKVTRSASDLKEGDWIEGRVRNVESYGAWVDIGLERDALLHVREMSETFTPKPQHVLSTRDEVRVRVKFVDPRVGKVGLSLVEDGPREGDLPPAPPRPQISISDISPGAELWGHVERATNIGAYVNVGAEVPGFLHLKEVPGRPLGEPASAVLPRNKRLRVYPREVDTELRRIKLTCKRPKSKPRCGPRAVLASDEYLEEFEYDDRALLRAALQPQWDEEEEEEEEDWGDEDGWGDAEAQGFAAEADEDGELLYNGNDQHAPVAEVR